MTLNYLDMITILMVFWGPVIVLWQLSEYKKRQGAISSAGWTDNTGSRPALFHVDVVFNNGKSMWNATAKEVDFDLYAKNSVAKFRKAEAVG